jgi:adenylate cyclase
MGSAKRFNYSAMGDVVNVAARIESASKEFRSDILVSEDVARAAPGLALLEAGEIMLKGKSKPTRLYALAGDEAFAGTSRFAALKQTHAALLAALAAGESAAAASAIPGCRAQAGATLIGLYDHFGERIASITTEWEREN